MNTLIPGPGLTSLGKQQAEALPSALRERGIEALFASTMIRTQLTVAPLARALGLEVHVLDGVHEINAGSLEGRTDPAANETYHEAIFAWLSRDLARAVPGGPDGHDFFERYDRSITEVVAAGHDTAVVVSHGAAIRTWAGGRCRNLDAEFVMAHPLSNTGVVEISGDVENGWTCLRWEGEPPGGDHLNDPQAADPMSGSSGGS